MKKILLVLFLILFARSLQSQTLDTANWGLLKSSPTSYYDLAYNKIEYYGVGVGLLRVPIAYVIDDASTLDTTVWAIIRPYPTSYYNYITNIAEWYGYDSATVRIPFSFSVGDIGGSSFDADSMWAYLEANTTHNIGVNVLTGDTLTGVVLNISRNANIDSLIVAKIIGDLTVTGDINVNRAYIDTLITHTIDSVASTYWINSSGDTIGYVDVTRDTAAMFTTLFVKRGNIQSVISSDSITTPKVVIPSGTAWYFNIGGVDYWFLDATGFYPALTSAYNFGSSTYLIDSIRANHLQLFEHLIGNTQIRDTNSFDNDAASDTVTVSNATISDLYFIQTMGQTVSANDYCVVEPTATGFIVRRSASGTANLRYAWWRLK